MLMEKSVFSGKEKREKKVFSAFALGGERKAGTLTADASVNCEVVDGVLQTGVGVAAYTLADWTEFVVPSNLPAVDGFFLLPKREEDGSYTEKFGYISKNGALFLYDESADALTQRYDFGCKMKAVVAVDSAAKEKLILAGDGGVYAFTEDEGATLVASERALCAACVAKGRVFCALEPDTLAYSAPYEPTDFSQSLNGGGCIRLPSAAGKIRELVAFDEGVYLLYEYGVFRVRVAGAARDFVVETVGYNGGRICGGAQVCSVGGNKLFFLAEDGLYACDGSKTYRVCEPLKIRPAKGALTKGAAAFEGKYFVCFTDAAGLERGVLVDAERETGYYAFATEGLSACRGRACCRERNTLQFVCADGALPLGEAYTFTSRALDFDDDGEKLLRTLRVLGEGEVQIEVQSGKTARKKTLVCVDGEAVFDLKMRGKAFVLRLTLSQGARVFGVEAVVSRLQSSGVKKPFLKRRGD